MHPFPLVVNEPPALSDEAAAQLLDLLYELTTAFENYYANQLRRYAQEIDRSQAELFDDHDREQDGDDELTF
jgi:hypothetical protein